MQRHAEILTSLMLAEPDCKVNKVHGVHGSSCAFRTSFRIELPIDFLGDRKSLINQGSSGGRTRDRTLDLSRVKAALHNDITLSLSAPFPGYSPAFWPTELSMLP